ncbi:predicted protein [Sclerotinia sclerotiorum 1980 UF-70]|uniref:Uncharacterized protein n=1 Tax=Sclerotinia sclerotiorum (strain ATCC 18683 / 1980 / Ss-1) TaxID=665079 RepID=A7ETD3_SCLS1|nr:predicted protein [Sclerotinia sclerotiorum 1980 UF-70]EDN92725.1 predicted protein [Sclerotinia sclerotiorum 1980 UF-70]
MPAKSATLVIPELTVPRPVPINDHWWTPCWRVCLGGSSAIIDLMEHHQETHFQEHGILIIQDR